MTRSSADLATTFDDLIRDYYGRIDSKPVLTVEEVVAGYYGRPVAPRRRWPLRQASGIAASGALSLRSDDGETLRQRRHARARVASAFEAVAAIPPNEDEYVVGGASPDAPSASSGVSSPTPAAGLPGASVASPGPAPTLTGRAGPSAKVQAPAPPLRTVAAASMAEGEDVTAEYLVDVRDPLAAPDASATPAAPTASRAAVPEPPTVSPSVPRAAPGPPPTAGAASVPPHLRLVPPLSQTATVEEAELAADMEAILSGQKIFNPSTGQLADRQRLVAEQTSHEPEPPDTADPASAPPRPAAEAPNEQAIFDRIAQSMQYANAYDLGTVELENRFASFDRDGEALRQANAAKAAANARNGDERPADERVGSEDFIRDLDAIREARADVSTPEVMAPDLPDAPDIPSIATPSSVADWTDDPDRDSACGTSALQLALTESTDDYSQPLFDTGEHVIAGGDLFPNRLRLGRQPGVAFSYGQLIAMADLYESVDQMLQADPAELNRVKALVDRSTQYYRGNKATRSLDVSNDEWDRATGGRYLRLAEDNYDHFSPNVLFNDAVARTANRRANNQSSWRAHHMRAIGEAQRFFAGNPAADAVPEWALTVNAFGDHFLTDAFASGHLISKELMIAYFRSNFYDGRSLKPAARTFFQRVAEQAFVGEVRRRFSALETTDYPVCAWGWCLRWHPNINSVDRFRSLLIAAAEQEPEKVANFAVKALHDKLNREGIEVTNGAGDGTWKLTGDGHMNAKTLAVMRKAVQASVANVQDRTVPAGIRDFTPYWDKVWTFVPRLTPASQTRLTALVREYTSPTSTALSTAAAEVIRSQVDSLINVLIREGKLKPA